MKNIQEAIELYLEVDEDLKDLREAKEESKNEEGVTLDKVIKVLKLRWMPITKRLTPVFSGRATALSLNKPQREAYSEDRSAATSC